MSEMLTPLKWDAPLPDAKPAPERFAWPMPPYASYRQTSALAPLEACCIVGLNDSRQSGRLVAFMPDEALVQVRVPPARAPLVLRFAQFRALELTTPLAPERNEGGGDTVPAELVDRPRASYRIELRDGAVLEGRTVGLVEHDAGLFLFPPQGEAGVVRRLFVPREAIARSEVGPRIGELLIEQRAATREQVEQAADAQRRLRGRKLGDILLAQQLVTPDQLLAAIDAQSKMPMVRIGEALKALGLVSDAQLDAALAEQQRDRTVPLGELLVQSGAVSRQELQIALARKMGYPLVDLPRFPVEVEAVKRIAFALAQRLKALPLLLREGRLVVALEDPGNAQTIIELEFAAQTKVVPVLAPIGTIAKALPAAFEKAGANLAAQLGSPWEEERIEYDPDDTGKLMESLEREGAERGRPDEDKPIEQSDNSLVRLINNMIAEAAAQGASDIHIENHPGREKTKIRFRKDGVLGAYLELPHNYRSALVARIKIMCDLDISERRKPQDGKINFAKFSPAHKVELRVATIPTSNGLEDVVMRILASARPIAIGKLGLAPRNLEQLVRAVERPYGLLLCVGPTGSGKTTTLHSALSHINRPERKIWTAEDPIEITQPGLRQVRVNPKIEWTFAKALRAFLRADPDVIMVGEIRDQETAQVAIEASLTGHLVLSTLHTNSAPETVTRLLDMGMDPFNFGDSLLAVLAQRLVRALCPHCRTERAATRAEIDELLADWLAAWPADDACPSRETVRTEWLARHGRDGVLMHHASPGCKHCGDSGTKGRAALHELMPMSRPLRGLIQGGARAEELQRVAMQEGMRTLRQDGIEKVLAGVTTIEDVRAMSNV